MIVEQHWTHLYPDILICVTDDGKEVHIRKSVLTQKGRISYDELEPLVNTKRSTARNDDELLIVPRQRNR